MLSKYKKHKFAIFNSWQNIAISQWSAENGIIKKFIMNVCAQLVMFLGMSTILLYNARLIQISEVHICHLIIGENHQCLNLFSLCDRCNIISKIAVFIFECSKC